jgi:hypothetical protein
MQHIVKWLGAIFLCLAPVGLVAETPRGAVRHYVDHIVVGVNNLEFGMAQLKALTGVDPVIGGVHPGAGTRNALISLGDETYLEILAPNPAADPAAVNAMGRRFLDMVTPLDQITPVTWALGSTDLAATRALLAKHGDAVSEPVAGSRRKPDGALLHWQTARVESASGPATPFFIQWAEGDSPALATPKGCTLARFSLAADDQLRGMLHALAVPFDLVEDQSPAVRVELSCPTGLVILP